MSWRCPSDSFRIILTHVFRAWSRLQLGILIVLRDGPCRGFLLLYVLAIIYKQ